MELSAVNRTVNVNYKNIIVVCQRHETHSQLSKKKKILAIITICCIRINSKYYSIRFLFYYSARIPVLYTDVVVLVRF